MASRIGGSRRWVVAAAAGAAALVAAACGGGSGSGNSASAPGITGTTVTIGSTQPLTGPAALGYSEIAPASKAYFAYVNAHGGVHGRTVKYTYLDDGYVPSNTPTQTRKLVLQDKVYAIFNALGTPTHLAVVDYLNTEKVPDLFVASGCNCWNNASQHRYTFGWQPDYTIEGKILGQYIKQTYSGMKVGYFAQGPNDEFGTDGIIGLNDALQGSGVNILTPPQYYPPTAAGASAVKSAIATLQTQGAQVIAAFSVPLFTAIAEATAAALNYHPIFVVSNVGSDPPTLSKILTGGALGVALPAALITGMVSDYYLPVLSDSGNPWISLFKSIKNQYAPSLPWHGNVLYGIAAAYTFVQALQAAGQNPTRDDLVHAIENSHWTGPGLVPFGYSSGNHLGYLGVQIDKTSADGTQSTIGPVYTTDDTSSGAIKQYSGTASTPPASGIPSD